MRNGLTLKARLAGSQCICPYGICICWSAMTWSNPFNNCSTMLNIPMFDATRSSYILHYIMLYHIISLWDLPPGPIPILLQFLLSSQTRPRSLFRSRWFRWCRPWNAGRARWFWELNIVEACWTTASRILRFGDSGSLGNSNLGFLQGLGKG